MKKLFLLATFGVVILGGYPYVRARAEFERLRARIEPVLSEPQFETTDSIKARILREAEVMGVPLTPEGVQVVIRDTDRKSLGETMLERPGIEVESKLLIVYVRYPVELWGFRRTFAIDIERPFTARAAIVNPNRD